MSGKQILMMFFLSMVSVFSFAESCVKVRDACMAFSKEQRSAAKEQGLLLGTPYKQVRAKLLRQGWKEKNDEDGSKLTCGSGRDAACSAEFIRGQKSIFLTFSSVNNGIPLTSVVLGTDQ